RRRGADPPECHHRLHVRGAHAQRGEPDLRGLRAGVWRGGAGVRVLRDDRRRGRGGRGARHHHRPVPASADDRSRAHQHPERLMLLLAQAAAAADSLATHPLQGTVARWLWAVPMLPLLGFVLNGALSLFSAYHVGPADPSAAGHDHADHVAHVDHADHAAAGHDDDHHPVVRHRFAALSSIIGPGVLLLAFALVAAIWAAMRSAGGGAIEAPYVQRYFSWIAAGDLHIDAAFQLDQLSMLMMLVITGVGTLIHVFSVGYMRDDPGYPRYFAYLNLFVFFMLLLVLGASYPLLFIGWEGVGVCSYLLIDFWFSDKANTEAGKKAFIANRVGDAGFLIAMFLLFSNLHTLSFTGVHAATGGLGFDSALVTTICLFLFVGCAGKSAQIPLY